METRICKKCKVQKPLDLFYYYTRKNNGISYQKLSCKECEKSQINKIRNSPHGKEVSRRWQQSEAGKIANKNRYAKYREKHPMRIRAYYDVHNALRTGKLKQQPCRICKVPNAEGHHVSYEESLSVDWLCRKCHHKLHYSS
jgi:hypothetical protein